MESIASRAPVLTAVFSADFLGGSELFNLEYLKRAAERGVRVNAILPGEGALAHALEPLASSIQIVPPPPSLTGLSRFDRRVSVARLPRQGLAAVSYARRLRRAVAQTQGPICCLGFRAQLAVGYLARPRRRSVAWVVHEVVPNGAPGAAWTRASRRTAAIFALSVSAGRQVLLEGSSVQIIPGRLDLHRFSEVPAASPPLSVLGLVGDLFRLKNHFALFELVARLRHRGHDVRGVIIGRPQLGMDADYAQQIARVASEPGAKVTLASADPEEMPARMGEMDVLLHLTTVPESFGRVCVEAMAAGRPVVAFDHGAVSEVVRPGVTGYLLPPGDLDGVEQAILRLVENPGTLAKLARGARRVALDKYAATPAHETIGDALADLAALDQKEPSGGR